MPPPAKRDERGNVRKRVHEPFDIVQRHVRISVLGQIGKQQRYDLRKAIGTELCSQEVKVSERLRCVLYTEMR